MNQNLQMPYGINFYQPFQQSYNSAFKSFLDYEIEKNMRQTIQQDMQLEYDNIIGEANFLLNIINNTQGSSLAKDTYSVYLVHNGNNFINQINNATEIEQELSKILLREVSIVQDTKDIVLKKRNNSHQIYLPLFLIHSRVEPTLVFDIYDQIKNGGYYFNLFTYTQFLQQRLSSQQYNNQEQPNFIKLFIDNMTLNNNSEYIHEWLTYFFKTLRRISSNIVFVGNKDVSEEIFYKGIIKQIFGFDYCITITDEVLKDQSIETIVQNKLFIHINNIPENVSNQKKLKELLEDLIVYKQRGDINGTVITPFLCQIIFTLEQPHPFLNDFLSHSKVFFIDTMDNINTKLDTEDRVSLLNNITQNLMAYCVRLASVPSSQFYNPTQGINITPQEAVNQRSIHYSNKWNLNDTVKFQNKEYTTDNEFYKNWLKNPELMELALSYNSQNPILDPFDNSFDTLLPQEDRYKHTYITGKTGSGKSELLKTLIYKDIIKDDCSVILLDIHGDLAKSVTRLVKDKERLVLIDPILEKDWTPTINLFHTDDKSEENIEQISQMISTILNEINVGDSPSGAMIDILENCIPLLVRSKDKDFYNLKELMRDIPKVASGTKEVKEINNDVRNEIQINLSKYQKNKFETEYFEEEFMEVNNSTRQAVKRRLNKILKDSKFSNLTNGENTINLQKEMNSSKNKVIIFNIPKGKMLNTYTYYIKFIIGLIQIIALKRADTPEKNRQHTHLYIDEFHNFITPTIEEILTESRKYKLFLTFAHQSVSQIKDSNLRDIILDNTNVKIIGKNSNKTLDVMNKTLSTKLENVEKLQSGEFNLQSGNNDVIRIRNTDKLLGNKEEITDEQWEEHKEHQLEKYYRSIKKEDEKKAIESKRDDDFDTLIDKFIQTIKNKDLSETSCLRNIEQERFVEIEEDFNYINPDTKIEQPRIRQEQLNVVFQLAFNQNEILKNRQITKKLNESFGEATMMNRDKKYGGSKPQEKYYSIPV